MRSGGRKGRKCLPSNDCVKFSPCLAWFNRLLNHHLRGAGKNGGAVFTGRIPLFHPAPRLTSPGVTPGGSQHGGYPPRHAGTIWSSPIVVFWLELQRGTAEIQFSSSDGKTDTQWCPSLAPRIFLQRGFNL